MPHAHEGSVTTAVNRAVRRPTAILWLNEAPVYRRAAAQAGLADRVEFHEVPVNVKPAPDVLERCDALLAWQVVDDDLVAAARAGAIAGAVLDVFRREPLPPDHPFWATEGITVLPHIGGLHPARDELVATLFVENLGRFLAGRPLLHVVDHQRGY